MASSGWGERVWVNLLRIAPRRAFTGVVRALAAIPVPRSMRRVLLGWAARRMGMNLAEAELPVEAYRSLGALFVRRLHPGARPIDPADDALVSPVDGCFVNQGTVTEGELLQAKGISYSLAELVGDEGLAARFMGGTFATVYLRPKDYHRIHCPTAAEVVATRRIPGTLYPVQPAFVRRRRGLFTGNERLVVELASDNGALLVVPVGAMGVGTITTTFGAGKGYQRYTPRVPLAKGAELGAFNLGSTVILVFERDRVELGAHREGQELQVGQSIGRWRNSARGSVSPPTERTSGQARSA